MPSLAFSVIIPLEFHRGLAERCIWEWTRGQDFPRESYQIIIAAPRGHNRKELGVLESLLGRQDGLLLLPYKHDMSLVAAAAHEAAGDAFFFTEAHCLPKRDVLSRSAEALAQHPDWAGFSGRSTPITHNLLSRIEAEMYDEDIQRNLVEHPWLKVLDQCLVVRRDAYFAAGGIEPEYGHFAEWLLAARSCVKTLKISYYPEVEIRHYYIGRLRDLVDFTEDFSEGQLRFAAQDCKDPCQFLFDPVQAWEMRHRWNRRFSRKLALVLARDTFRAERGARRLVAQPGDGWSLLRRTMMDSVCGLRGRIVLAQLKAELLKLVVHGHLWWGNREKSARSFHRLMTQSVKIGHLRGVRRIEDTWGRSRAPGYDTTMDAWVPGSTGAIRTLGLHPVETSEGTAFQWTEAAAMAELPLPLGENTLKVSWREIRPVDASVGLCFYVNEQPVPENRLRWEPLSVEIALRVDVPKPVRLSWVCKPFHAPGDSRSLGLPISKIAWSLSSFRTQSDPNREGTCPVNPQNGPAGLHYFLHIKKCAGTTLAIMLENAFPAADIAAPYLDHYYHFEMGQLEVRKSCRLIRGHYGWLVPSQMPDRPWKIVTVLRDPLERLLSHFDYHRQHRRQLSNLSLEEWISGHIGTWDLMTRFFLPPMGGDQERGCESVAGFLKRNLEIALRNLRSCRAVGLKEEMEDTINLMSWIVGFLPPEHTPRVNATLNRFSVENFSPRLQRKLTVLLEADRALYHCAQTLFAEQHAAMHDRLREEAGTRLNTQQVREFLRRRVLAREAVLPSGRTNGKQIRWAVGDVYLGENLHRRERHHGDSLRWTGPSEETKFYFPVPSSEVWRSIFIRQRLSLM